MKGYTIQNSINLLEKNSGGGGGTTSASASDVTYDNTSSGLTADNVQEAIDELKSDIPTTMEASNVSYDNTSSGLTADDVQEAIDELNSKGFGNVITISDLTDFDTVNDTYTFNVDGIAVIKNNTLDADVRVTITKDSIPYTYESAIGASGCIVMPIKNGETMTLTALSNATLTGITIYPLTAPVVNANTRKTSKKK